ncbi:MAG: hypothetical protein KIT24_05765 [Phycisphaeraceae bacterium]|nr:hypothetical protein [Phycisphaeraceae bacterium]
MDPAVLRQLAIGALPPALGGLVVFGALLAADRPRSPTLGASLGKAPARPLGLLHCIAATGIFVSSFAVAFGGVRQPPQTAFDQLPYVALAALGVGIASMMTRWGHWLGAAAGAAVGLVALFRFKPALHEATFAETAPLVVLTCILVFGGVAGASQSCRACRAWIAALLLLIPAAGASAMLTLGHYSLKLGQGAGVLAAMLLGIALAATLWRKRSLGVGVGVIVAVLLGMVVVQGHLFAPTPRSLLYAVLTALGFILPCLVDFAPKAPRLGVFPSAGIRLLLAVLPVATGVAIAAATRTSEAS